MGKYTTNYSIPNMDHTLETAYAVIRDLTIRGSRGTAVIAIQKTRELALNGAPFQTIKFEFDINRNESPYITAYKKASEEITYKEKYFENPEDMLPTEIEVKKGGPLYGWEDDIIVE